MSFLPSIEDYLSKGYNLERDLERLKLFGTQPANSHFPGNKASSKSLL
jgi:hypothetical protein